MNLPFTVEQFLNVFKTYNLAIWPLQVIVYLAGLFFMLTLLKPNTMFNRINSGILSCFWLLMGIGYHWIFFTKINNAAYIFGLLFVIQGILFLIFGVWQNKLSFGIQKLNIYSGFGWLAVAYGMLIYPALGFVFGHVFPNAPVFGIAPCPTTIFTFGVFLLTLTRIPKSLLIIPVLWSFLGFSAALSLGIKEDFGLSVAGVLATILVLVRDKREKSSPNLST